MPPPRGSHASPFLPCAGRPTAAYRKARRKLNRLIEECLRHPFEGTGKPEPLRGDLAGFRSRRIDREHRLVYRVTASAIEVVQCRYHH